MYLRERARNEVETLRVNLKLNLKIFTILSYQYRVARDKQNFAIFPLLHSEAIIGFFVESSFLFGCRASLPSLDSANVGHSSPAEVSTWLSTSEIMATLRSWRVSICSVHFVVSSLIPVNQMKNGRNVWGDNHKPI
jgi:hypothetical protein